MGDHSYFHEGNSARLVSLLPADITSLVRERKAAAAVATPALTPAPCDEPRICGGGKTYCVICHNFDGKVLADGTVVQMHRIPAEPDPSKTDPKSLERKRQRKIWIQRIKSARVDVNVKPSTRICSEHFTGRKYGGSPDEVPVFLHLDKPSKTPKVR